MPNSPLDQMISHLEFLGYRVERLDKGIVARHDKHLNLIMQDMKGGVLFTTFFTSTNAAKRDKAAYLEWINRLNAQTVALRYYAGDELQLIGETWYPALYDKASFGAFVELLNGSFAAAAGLDVEKSRKFLE